MKMIKKLLSLLPLMILWLMLSVILWGFVFTRLTDTDARHKIVVCVDAQVSGSTELAVELEKEKDAALRMIQVRPFSYAMLDSSVLRQADLYIIPLSDAETYADWLTPLPEEMSDQPELLLREGVAWGIKIYDAALARGSADAYIGYGPEDYYLFFGKSSLHVPGNPDAADCLALDIARRLTELR